MQTVAIRGPDCIFHDFILRVKPLFKSTIPRGNREWIGQLPKWLPSTLQHKNMKLCYKASVNGRASSTFHNLCDNKGPTVVLVESGKYVFGGFAAAPWGGKHWLFKLFHCTVQTLAGWRFVALGTSFIKEV